MMKKSAKGVFGEQLRMSGSQCPHCFEILEYARAIGEPNAQPRRGDYTICLNCKNILEFDKRLRLISARQSTLEKIAGRPEYITANRIAFKLSDRILEVKRKVNGE